MSKDPPDKDLPEEHTVIDRALSDLLMEMEPTDLAESGKPEEKPRTPWRGDTHGAGTRVLGKPEPTTDSDNGSDPTPNDWSLHGSHEEVTGLWERSWDQEGAPEETTGSTERLSMRLLVVDQRHPVLG